MGNNTTENMTEIEAKVWLKAISSTIIGVAYPQRKEALFMGMQALEKQIPKKPDFEGDGYSDGHLVYDTWICPNCEKHYEVDYDNYDYCPNCGQKIDWEADHEPSAEKKISERPKEQTVPGEGNEPGVGAGGLLQRTTCDDVSEYSVADQRAL